MLKLCGVSPDARRLGRKSNPYLVAPGEGRYLLQPSLDNSARVAELAFAAGSAGDPATVTREWQRVGDLTKGVPCVR